MSPKPQAPFGGIGQNTKGKKTAAEAARLFGMRAPTNRLSDLLSLVPRILESLLTAKRGEVTWVGR